MSNGNAPRRTRLAGERTQLAWWRTGLAAFAVGIGVGRVVPMLDPTVTVWPYMLLGIGFVVYGILLVQFGIKRGSHVDQAVSSGESASPGSLSTNLLGVMGIVLGIGTALIILLDS
jgi:uncharacterized membrane protein YidH (DUF202 family)